MFQICRNATKLVNHLKLLATCKMDRKLQKHDRDPLLIGYTISGTGAFTLPSLRLNESEHGSHTSQSVTHKEQVCQTWTSETKETRTPPVGNHSVTVLKRLRLRSLLNLTAGGKIQMIQENGRVSRYDWKGVTLKKEERKMKEKLNIYCSM